MKPIVEVVTPGRGHTGGRTLVQVEGQGFRLPPAPPANPTGPMPPPIPTVEVLFDGRPARAVQVVSESLLRCLTPAHPPERWVYLYTDGHSDPAPLPNATPAPSAPPGTTYTRVSRALVDVTVTNLADDGAAIPGESTVLADAYSFVRPQLAPTRGAWARVLLAVQQMLQDMLLENVAIAPAVDYDRDTGDPTGYIALAGGPGIALAEISFPESTEVPTEAEIEIPLPNDYVLVRKRPMANDLTCNVVCVGDNLGELLNLAEATEHVIRDFGVLELPNDPADETHGLLSYHLLLVAPGMQVSQRFGPSDVQTMQAGLIIRNILSSDIPGAPTEGLPQIPRWMPHQATRGLTRTARVIDVTGRNRKP